MDILSIDIGTYSVKFARGVLERRQIRFLECQEELLSDPSRDFHPTMPLRERQIEIVKSFWDESEDSKVIFQVPNWLLTSRYLTLPTIKQKQISMMIPFQLEEKLPFPIARAHYVPWVEKKKDQSRVAVSIVQKNDFQDYYDFFDREERLPSVLTSELFAINCYLATNPLAEAAVILDLGHETTNAYFLHEGAIVSNQTSCMGGKIIDETISETYGVAPEEASEYKHKNCFLVTSDQYGSLTDEQKEFADLMEKIFVSLFQEYKRWELGYRINYGKKIETIYLMGGTSKIHNISNFLMESLGVNVEYFPEGGHLKKDEPNFSMAKLMGLAQKGKHALPNFLHGEYAGKSGDDAFLHSAGFLFGRTLVVSIIAIVFLLIERFAFIHPAISKQDRVNKKIFKSSEVALTTREKRSYRRKPERVLKKLSGKFQDVEQEVSTILSSGSVNALGTLSLLSIYLDKNKDVEMVEFQSDGEKGVAVFHSEKLEHLQKLEQDLRDMALAGKAINQGESDKELVLTFGKK